MYDQIAHISATFTFRITSVEAELKSSYKPPYLGTNDEYEIGDLSGKYGTFLNLSSYRGRHVDYNLPLFGKNSIQGRSIVIHKMKTMRSARWVCADVHQVVEGDNMFVMKTRIMFTGPTLQGYMLLVSQCYNAPVNVKPQRGGGRGGGQSMGIRHREALPGYLTSKIFCWVRHLSGDMGNLTFTRCPRVRNLTLAPMKMSNAPGSARLSPVPWGLTLTGAEP